MDYSQKDKINTPDKKSVANAVVQQKPAFQFTDNRAEAIAQRKLQEKMNTHLPTTQGKATAVVQKVDRTSNTTVIQLNGDDWTNAKAERYKKWLRRRAARRLERGKRKPSAKLVRKYVKARQAANKGWTPKLADSPTSGHHVPPLALANKHKGKFVYGKRGSKNEKLRKRVYFQGKKRRRREAHWMAHEAEAMQGINRQTNFTGTDSELADRMILAHDGLTTMDKKPIKVRKRSQGESATTASKEIPIGKATRSILKAKVGKSKMVVDTDSDDSEPESNFEELGSDSDEFTSGSDSDSSSDD